MRTVKKIHVAENAPIEDLITYRALPTRSIDQIDPFLFLNHHGPQVYPQQNNGLPFGPHPHRGMETVTFILDGDILHKDSDGHESVITSGGVQWMTAGRGLIHAETSSRDFKEKGGKLEILQLWLNLPAKLKMTEPFYQGLQKNEIPAIVSEDGKLTIQLVAGEWEGWKAAFQPLTGVNLNTISFRAGAKLDIRVPVDENIFFYVIKGKLTVNGEPAVFRQLVEFNNNDDGLHIEANSESILLFGHARPFNEPVVARGPFVMNTQAEIQQAYSDFQQGKFGNWQD